MGGPGSGRFPRTRPDGEGAYVGRRWEYFTPLIPLDQRVMPVTMSHEEVAAHPPGCECVGCTAYRAHDQAALSNLRRLHRRRVRDRQMRSSASSDTTVST